ncbi:MAG TPA: hypothetical protein PLI59_15340 [Candidatus Obscuribacter sp.]|nr:hypothetical protein [Candidatus Obscuribacter sp.]
MKASGRWRLKPAWALLIFGLAVFYDLNPMYPFLLPFGVNAHLPIPKVVDASWAKSSQPSDVKVVRVDLVTGQVTLSGARGLIELKTYSGGRRPTLGVVVAGGVAGTFDSPACGLYDKLGNSLSTDRLMTVHLCFRKPQEFAETVYDARAAVQYLKSMGVERVILVGHSLGGAAMISAAAFEPNVIGVVPISSQPYGANPVSDLGSKKILVMTGLLDVVEPPAWSRAIFKEAVGERDIAYFPGSHNLDECADGVYERLRNWILSFLG